MSFSEKIQRSKNKVRQAEQALESYSAAGFDDSEEGRKLVNAVKSARDEYLNQLSELVLESSGSIMTR